MLIAKTYSYAHTYTVRHGGVGKDAYPSGRYRYSLCCLRRLKGVSTLAGQLLNNIHVQVKDSYTNTFMNVYFRLKISKNK